MQPVDADRQIRRPDDDAIVGLAFGDNLNARNDFPAQRERGGLAELGPRRLPDRTTTGLVQKPVRRRGRQGIEDDFQRGRVRHMAVTLTVDKFGLNSQFSGFGEKVHSARGLHATGQETSRNSLDAGRG